ncbi:hypothetical protein ES707_14069 [subsurface metagenome]
MFPIIIIHICAAAFGHAFVFVGGRCFLMFPGCFPVLPLLCSEASDSSCSGVSSSIGTPFLPLCLFRRVGGLWPWTCVLCHVSLTSMFTIIIRHIWVAAFWHGFGFDWGRCSRHVHRMFTVGCVFTLGNQFFQLLEPALGRARGIRLNMVL